MADVCELCQSAPIEWFCPSDQANLCTSCDTMLHTSNVIFSRHQRFVVSNGVTMEDIPPPPPSSEPPPPAQLSPPPDYPIAASNPAVSSGDDLVRFKADLAVKMNDMFEDLTLKPQLSRPDDNHVEGPALSGPVQDLEKSVAHMDGIEGHGSFEAAPGLESQTSTTAIEQHLTAHTVPGTPEYALNKQLVQTFSLLQPAFDSGLLDNRQFMHLVELDNLSNFKFVLKILEWYMQDQAKMMCDLHILCFDPATNAYRYQINFIKMRFLLHKLRGSSSNAGATGVMKGCLAMRNLCSQGIDGFTAGPGNYACLKASCDQVNTLFVEFFHCLRAYLIAAGDTEIISLPYMVAPVIPDALPAGGTWACNSTEGVPSRATIEGSLWKER